MKEDRLTHLVRRSMVTNGFAPEPLDTITDVVLTYRPKPKSKAGKKRKRKEKKIANA